MVYYFSRRAFVRAASGLLVGVTAIGNVPFINPLQIARAQATPATWMASIDDNTLLSRLTIPGTHESCARHGGPLTACQSTSVRDQLNAGIRFLDIRCRYISNTVFAIHHASVYQDLMFGDVLNACTAFLQTNPSERIMMSVKQEYSTAASSQFAATFDSYMQRWGGAGLWYTHDPIPAMKDVRGKIVLFPRFAHSGLGPLHWQDNATFEGQWGGSVYKIQDEYQVPTTLSRDINHKWGAINNLLDQAAADTSDTWYINFTSGASAGAYPNAIAHQIHPTLYTKLGVYLSEVIAGNTFPNRLGTLMLDFPDTYEINLITNLNWVSELPN